MLSAFKLSPAELMELALREAAKGSKKVRPNPRVGAALELNTGEVISGFHAFAGGPHAERVVLKICREKKLSPRGARMAVTLEPCSHWGKTPPCTEALIEAELAEVVFPLVDPNPEVRGKGAAQLKKENIKVVEGVGKSAAYQLNREWLWAQVLERPFVTLKLATSENHVWKMAAAASTDHWITSEVARYHAQQLRHRSDLLITSGQTVRDDDPALTARNALGEISDEQPRILVLSQKKNWKVAGKILKHPAGFQVEAWDSLAEELSKLFKEKKIVHVMLEAGPSLSQDFLTEGLVDEVWRYVNHRVLEGKQENLLPFFQKNFFLYEKIQLDAQNRVEKWLHKDRDEKKYFARL